MGDEEEEVPVKVSAHLLEELLNPCLQQFFNYMNFEVHRQHRSDRPA